ncbi:MAG TPA: hypothetical protein DIS76_06815, partial [Rhodospirillaceae bacterium]|nr:hypothetical protein [Rhodospirillaceae bacterium]
MSDSPIDNLLQGFGKQRGTPAPGNKPPAQKSDGKPSPPRPPAARPSAPPKKDEESFLTSLAHLDEESAANSEPQKTNLPARREEQSLV